MFTRYHKPVLIVAVFVIALLNVSATSLLGEEPLPSWQDVAARAKIIAYVESVTDADSDRFIPPSQRIAVFDNDGTLWCEAPIPIQLAYIFDSLRKKAEEEPELKKDPAVAAVLKGDYKTALSGGLQGLLKLTALTHVGQTTDDFRANVQEWIETARHPTLNYCFKDTVYQPMIEVINYLQANGFKTFIVSGGGSDFMRAWSEEIYNIPPEQVVGSNIVTKFELRGDEAVLVKTMDDLFLNDKEGKPVGIQQFIGRRPVLCFGNSDGDQAMLEYTTMGNPLPSLGVIVHHTDAEREFAYDKNPPSSGKLITALEAAPARGWVVVDMKNDWKTVFNPAKALDK